ncbi:MAG: efflux RND transporter permease subunit [Planctomycetota bacterium]
MAPMTDATHSEPNKAFSPVETPPPQLLPLNPSSLQGHIVFAVQRPVTIFMFTLAVVVFGYVSYQRLALNLMPDISYPTLTVRTEYLGAPADLEELISKPVEQALGVINNLINISSISRAGVSDVVLEFSWGTDMDEIYQSVREKLGQVFLPKEASKPLILRYDPALDPILRLGLYGTLNEFEMRTIAEDEIKRRIESINGVAAVRVKGGLEGEILIELNPNLLEKYKLDIAQVVQRLREENINVASGRLKEADTEYLVRSINQFKTLEEIHNLVIIKRQDQKIRLSDLGTVKTSHKDREVITRINKNDSVEIAIYKEGDANLVRVADTVKIALFGSLSPDDSSKSAETKPIPQKNTPPPSKGKGGGRSHESWGEKPLNIMDQLPAGIKLEILSDQSVFIKKAINEVNNTVIEGTILAILILFVFLKKISLTLIISISIPISIIATFAPMYIYQVSLNIMSLGGLALGAGMLVDNSIVVLESISRKREEGEDLLSSAIHGTQEVTGAVVASTLTTVCVFFPIVFVEGIAGQIFKDQALTVVFSLMASLIVSLYLIPMLMTRQFIGTTQTSLSWKRFYSIQEIRHWFSSWKRWKFFLLSPLLLLRFLLYFFCEIVGKCLAFIFFIALWLVAFIAKILQWITNPILKIFFWISDYFLNGLHHLYSKTLLWTLYHSGTVLLPLFVLFGFSLQYVQYLGRELIPNVKQGEFTVEVFLPIGTPLEKTNEVLKHLEAKTFQEMGIALISSNIGVQKESISSSDEGEHTAKIYVRLKPEYASQEDQIIRSLYQHYQTEPELTDVKISYPSLFSVKTPVEIEIRGYHLQTLKKMTEEVVLILKQTSGFYNIRSTVKRGNPEIQIQYNRDLLAQYGLTIEDISNRVKNFMGEVATKYSVKDQSIDVLVRLEDVETFSVEELENLVVTPGVDQPKRLKDIATIHRVEGFSEIRRINQQRASLVSASLAGVDLSVAVLQIQQSLAKLDIPQDFEFVISGQNKEMEVSLASLKFTLILAIFLVYIILASQFESLLQPFIIIVSLPFAFIGVVFTLYYFSIPVSILVYIGLILLAGVVVNNAIVLIDCVNQLQAKGHSLQESVLQAGNMRLRPILMTTLTTVLGLLPMTGWMSSAGAEGEELRAPLAITVIAGLSSSTLLTLVVIPLIYSLLEKTKSILGFKNNTLK